METDVQRQNREAMPTIARLVDECRTIFGTVKVTWAKEGTIERGVQDTQFGQSLVGVLTDKQLAEYRAAFNPDGTPRERTTQELAEQALLATANRNKRTTRTR